MEAKELVRSLQQLGMTQTQIGDEIGLAQASVSKLLNNKVTDVRSAAYRKLVQLHRKQTRAKRKSLETAA